MSLKKTLCVLLVLCCLAASIPPFSAASELQDAVNRKNELQKQLDSLNEQLGEIKDDIELATEKANTYSSRKSIVEQQIAELLKSIDIKSEELAKKQSELDDKQRELDENYELFKKRLRAMYKNNNASTLSIVLGASSLTEMLTASETVKRVSEHDTELIDKITKERNEIEQAKIVIESELASLEADKAELDEKKNELAALLQEANSQLDAAEANQEATEAAYKQALQNMTDANAEIDRLMNESSDIDYVGGYYAWPVPGYPRISSYFGWRTLYGAANYHRGIDIAGSGIYGKGIIASNIGKVTTVVYGYTGYGHYVIIDHGGGYKTLYGHMSSINVSVGQWVAQGEVIGAVGSTGNSTGPHLHFEIRINGTAVNPIGIVVQP